MSWCMYFVLMGLYLEKMVKILFCCLWNGIGGFNLGIG